MAETDSRQIRSSIRSGDWQGTTVGRAGGYVQTGLVVLSKALAYDFLVFCQRNPRPCPLLEVTDPGNPILSALARGADIRTDLGSFSVWRDGVFVEEASNIKEYWKDDSVGFMIGSSLTFTKSLEEAGCESSTGIHLYRTGIPCVPSGPFAGHMVVTMRTLPPDKVARAVQVTTRFQATHGAPIHIGDPSAIGITDLSKPFDPVEAPQIPDGHLPLFWACSVTPQVIAQEAKIDFMITHTSGHGFVSDLMDYELAIP